MSADRPVIIGELINNSYGRARKAWKERNLEGYQHLAKLQSELGVSYLTLNTDGTNKLSVRIEEMIEFLPRLVPAIQSVTDVPISFDNPDLDFHLEALKHYRRTAGSPRPILNSLAVSRKNLDGFIACAVEYDMNVIVMATERSKEDGGHEACSTAEQIHQTTRMFCERLQKSGVQNDRIIVDPGLAPVASDLQGIINMGLDAMRLIRADKDLQGVHMSVGLSNFSIGSPEEMRIPLEKAYLRLAMDAGMDFALANPEKNTTPLPSDDELVLKLSDILASGRVQDGEDQSEAGYRQLENLMEMWEAVV